MGEREDSVRERGVWARWLGVLMVLVSACVRACVGFNAFPRWDVDPLAFPGVETTIGPSVLLGLDLAALVGAGLVLASAARVRRWMLACACAGAAAVWWHAAGDLEHLVVGGPWVATVFAMVAVAHLPAAGPERRVVFAAAMGLVFVLVARGAVQVWIEHAETLRRFETDRAGFFAARGWAEDSASARLYMRRLEQPEATAWFGLSNVFASFAAMAVVAGGVLAVGSARAKAWAACAPAVLIAAAGGLGLWLSASKGGAGAAAVIGALAALLMVPFVRAQTAKHARWVLPMVAAAGLLAVVARGLMGERIGELSLLFRWYYLEAAARIFSEHPVAGVGPAGFKDAYLLAKPALSPEEVISPHSVLADWISMLGVGGLAWCAALGGVLMLTGRRAAAVPPPPAAGDAVRRDPALRNLVVAAMVPVFAAVVASGWVEQAMATIEMAVARLGGLAVAGVGVWGVLVAWERAPRCARLASAAAAGVLVLHAMIEMTPVLPGSGVLWGVVIGAAAGMTSGGHTGMKWPWRLAAGGVPVAVAVGLGVWMPRLAAWEGHLARAAMPSTELGFLRQDLGMTGGTITADVVERAARLAGESPVRDGRSLVAQLERATQRARRDALDELTLALTARPMHPKTREAASRIAAELGEPDRAIELAEAGTRLEPGAAARWAWVATLRTGLAERSGGPERETHLRAAIEAAERAAALDPWGVTHAVRLAELHEALGESARAADWARRALELNAWLRLDPLKGLDEAERAWLEGVAAEGEGAAAGP